MQQTHFPQKIYKLGKTNIFFSHFEGTRGKKPIYFAPMMLVNFGNSRSLHLSSMQGNVMAVLRTLDKSEPWSVCKSSPGLGLVSAGKKEEVRNCKISSGRVFKGQLNSEWIYEVIVSPNQKLQRFLPYPLINYQGRNLCNFWLAFWEKQWTHKFILNLTDL